jgi:hypothetical protein
MKHYSKPTTVIPTINEEKAEDPIISDISVARLIDNGLLALHREMRNLLLLSAKGKLDAAASRDLRDTIKLLFELKDRENESLRGLTDEQLEQKVKEALKDGNK